MYYLQREHARPCTILLQVAELGAASDFAFKVREPVLPSISEASPQPAQAFFDSIGGDSSASQNDARSFCLANIEERQYLNGDARA